jgi:Zn-dependent protease with chaperone function
MYSQLLYFVVALLLFSIQQPGHEPVFGPFTTMFLGTGLLLLFVLCCHQTFRRLMPGSPYESSTTSLSFQFFRAQTKLSVLALANLAVYVYVLNIKYYLQRFPGFQQSMTLTGLAGLGIFMVHLAVIWHSSYPVYRQMSSAAIDRRTFLKNNLAFCSAILVPWFLVAAASDLLLFIKMPEFLQGDLGQFFLLAALLLVFTLFAPILVVRLWGCRPLPMDALREELERFAAEQRFRVGGFLLWPLLGGEMLTAGIIGILPRWRYILITRGLLNLLSADELKAVVAHEMGHVRRYHILLFFGFFLSYSLLIYAVDDLIMLGLLRNPTILAWTLDPQSGHATLLSAFFSLPMVLLMLLYFRYIFGFFLRNSERQADLYALQLIGDPSSLISSLRKIA